MTLCQCIKLNGQQCSFKAKHGTLFSGIHKACKRFIVDAAVVPTSKITLTPKHIPDSEPKHIPVSGTTKVINLKVSCLRPQYQNQLEWAENPNNVNIGRGNVLRVKTVEGYTSFPSVTSPFANPFTLKKHSREESIVLYEDYIRKKLSEDPNLVDKLLALKGKNLGCWCTPESCHGDVLIRLISETEESE